MRTKEEKKGRKKGDVIFGKASLKSRNRDGDIAMWGGRHPKK